MRWTCVVFAHIIVYTADCSFFISHWISNSYESTVSIIVLWASFGYYMFVFRCSIIFNIANVMLKHKFTPNSCQLHYHANRIEVNIPKKRTGSSSHAKSITKFYEAIYRAILTHIPFDKTKCVLLGSPGFQKDDFFKYMMAECVRREDRVLIENKNKFVLCHASSGHKHAIEELFLDEGVLSRVTETKVRYLYFVE